MNDEVGSIRTLNSYLGIAGNNSPYLQKLLDAFNYAAFSCLQNHIRYHQVQHLQVVLRGIALSLPEPRFFRNILV